MGASTAIDFKQLAKRWQKVSLDELIIFVDRCTPSARPVYPSYPHLPDLEPVLTPSCWRIPWSDVARRLEGVSLGVAMRPHDKIFDHLFIAMVMVGRTRAVWMMFLNSSRPTWIGQETRKRVTQALIPHHRGDGDRGSHIGH